MKRIIISIIGLTLGFTCGFLLQRSTSVDLDKSTLTAPVDSGSSKAAEKSLSSKALLDLLAKQDLDSLAVLKRNCSDFQARLAIEKSLERLFMKCLDENPMLACQWLADGKFENQHLFHKLLREASNRDPKACFQASLTAAGRAIGRQMLAESLKTIAFKDEKQLKEAFEASHSQDKREADQTLKSWSENYFKRQPADALLLAQGNPQPPEHAALVNASILGFSKLDPTKAVDLLKSIPERTELETVRGALFQLLRSDVTAFTKFLEGSELRPYLLRSALKTAELTPEMSTQLLTWAQGQDLATNHFTTAAIINQAELSASEAIQLMESLPFDRTLASSALSRMVKSGDYSTWSNWVNQKGGFPASMKSAVSNRLRYMSQQQQTEWLKQSGAVSIDAIAEQLMRK